MNMNMKIPTIEELEDIGCRASRMTQIPLNLRRKKYLTAIRDAVVAACRPRLRPIAEMTDQVPEGCVRHYSDHNAWYSSRGYWPSCTHFIDISLPAEAYPADFEQAFAESKLDAKDKDAAFKLWKGGER